MACRCGVDSGMIVVLLITAVLICLSWVSSFAFSYPVSFLADCIYQSHCLVNISINNGVLF